MAHHPPAYYAQSALSQQPAPSTMGYNVYKDQHDAACLQQSASDVQERMGELLGSQPMAPWDGSYRHRCSFGSEASGHGPLQLSPSSGRQLAAAPPMADYAAPGFAAYSSADGAAWGNFQGSPAWISSGQQLAAALPVAPTAAVAAAPMPAMHARILEVETEALMDAKSNWYFFGDPSDIPVVIVRQ